MKKIIVVSVTLLFLIVGTILFFLWKQDQEENFSDPFSLELNESLNSQGVNDSEDLPYSVTTDNTEATKIGMDVLEKGGNAVDAAIAVSYALGVAEPSSSGLGGGGVMVIDSPEMDPISYDYQVTNPENGKSKQEETGVPGFVLGMEKVHDDHGSLSMDKLIQPSVDLASNGVKVDENLHNKLTNASDRMPIDELENFYPEGSAIEIDENLKQSKLSKTLQLIQEDGSDVFYTGEIADEIVNHVEYIDSNDLSSYEVQKEQPMKGEFDDLDVYTVNPPGGGISLIQTLKLLDRTDIDDDQSLSWIEKTGHINQQVYQEKIQNIGDPKFVDVADSDLISEKNIDDMENEMTNSPNNSKEDNNESEDDSDDISNTTHFTIVDEKGMMVSATNTLSNFFGNGDQVSGFFLNNELRLFSERNSSPNKREPGKRPASYIAPAILSYEEKPVIGIGSAGGRRIPNMEGQILFKILKGNKHPNKAVSDSRVFMNPENESVAVEKDFPNWEKIVDSIDEKGYSIDYDNSARDSYFGSLQILAVDYKNKEIIGAADPRRGGKFQSN